MTQLRELPDFLRVCVRNSAKCLECGDEIESVHRHDFVRCKCGGIFIDGGRDRWGTRAGAKDFAMFQNTSIYRAMTTKEVTDELLHWEMRVEDDKKNGWDSKWNIEERDKYELALEEYADLLDGKVIS